MISGGLLHLPYTTRTTPLKTIIQRLNPLLNENNKAMSFFIMDHCLKSRYFVMNVDKWLPLLVKGKEEDSNNIGSRWK